MKEPLMSDESQKNESLVQTQFVHINRDFYSVKLVSVPRQMYLSKSLSKHK